MASDFNTCEICNCRTRGIMYHYLVHKKMQDFFCKFCELDFMNALDLSNHILSFHKLSLEYICPNCSKIYPNISEFFSHLECEHIKIPKSIGRKVDTATNIEILLTDSFNKGDVNNEGKPMLHQNFYSHIMNSSSEPVLCNTSISNPQVVLTPNIQDNAPKIILNDTSSNFKVVNPRSMLINSDVSPSHLPITNNNLILPENSHPNFMNVPTPVITTGCAAMPKYQNIYTTGGMLMHNGSQPSPQITATSPFVNVDDINKKINLLGNIPPIIVNLIFENTSKGCSQSQTSDLPANNKKVNSYSQTTALEKKASNLDNRSSDNMGPEYSEPNSGFSGTQIPSINKYKNCFEHKTSDKAFSNVDSNYVPLCPSTDLSIRPVNNEVEKIVKFVDNANTNTCLSVQSEVFRGILSNLNLTVTPVLPAKKKKVNEKHLISLDADENLHNLKNNSDKNELSTNIQSDLSSKPISEIKGSNFCSPKTILGKNVKNFKNQPCKKQPFFNKNLQKSKSKQACMKYPCAMREEKSLDIILIKKYLKSVKNHNSTKNVYFSQECISKLDYHCFLPHLHLKRLPIPPEYSTNSIQVEETAVLNIKSQLNGAKSSGKSIIKDIDSLSLKKKKIIEKLLLKFPENNLKKHKKCMEKFKKSDKTFSTKKSTIYNGNSEVSTKIGSSNMSVLEEVIDKSSRIKIASETESSCDQSREIVDKVVTCDSINPIYSMSSITDIEKGVTFPNCIKTYSRSDINKNKSSIKKHNSPQKFSNIGVKHGKANSGKNSGASHFSSIETFRKTKYTSVEPMNDNIDSSHKDPYTAINSDHHDEINLDFVGKCKKETASPDVDLTLKLKQTQNSSEESCKDYFEFNKRLFDTKISTKILDDPNFSKLHMDSSLFKYKLTWDFRKIPLKNKDWF